MMLQSESEEQSFSDEGIGTKAPTAPYNWFNMASLHAVGVGVGVKLMGCFAFELPQDKHSATARTLKDR